MAENSVKRKLRAILSADVKGYSRMMGEDEDGTYQALTTNLESIRSIISEYDGRVFSSPGDAVMAEFSSVVDAVQCAVELQEKIEASNADVPEDRKMQFRIGVNLGDVIHDGEQVYGDGVNIAARIETLAEPGKVSISQYVYNHAHKKLKFGYEYQGEHQVKNIAEPVKVYKVLTAPEHSGLLIGEHKAPKRLSKQSYISIFVILALVVAAAIWQFYLRPPKIEPASIEKMAYPLPDKPSIAVLPFDNMSNDPDQEYFADGISENIISSLSHIPGMFVIARNSTFTYKGKPVKVQQVSEELGVRYVLEGSVQRSGDQIRVTALLVDATTGHHLWSERYDRELKDLFDLQDEITLKILAALQIKLTGDQQARLWSKTDNLEAWGNHIKGSAYFEQYTKYDNSKARQLYEQAVKLDPDWEITWTMLAWTHWAEVRFGWSESPAESIKSAVEFARKATAINDTLPETHSLWSNIYLIQGEYEKAITEGQKAIALGPNNALCHVILSYTMTAAGRFEEAIELGERALRLNPYSSPWYLIILDDAYRGAGRYEEALAIGKRHLSRCRIGECSPFPAHLGLAATYIGLGQVEEARAHVAELLKIVPDFSLDNARKMISYKDPIQVERALDILRQAGLPEHAPLPLPDKPSIAVLAFDNLSGDPEQEYFSDGITEDIITALSKTPKIFVIARNSTFTYKRKAVKVSQVAEELGVQYVLEGSVRKEGDRIRITAQLIDALTGHHLWAERYDRDFKDIFALQDEITIKIIGALRLELTDGELARLDAKGTENLEAYLKLLQAREPFYTITKEGNIQARRLCEEAVALDPEYAPPYLYLGVTHWLDISLGSSKSSQESLKQAFKYIKMAIELDDSLPEAYSQLGWLYIMTRQYDKGIAECERAINLAPNSANAHIWMSFAFKYAGRHEEAVLYSEKALRLDPFPQHWYFRQMGSAYSWVGQHEEAIAFIKKAMQRAPNDLLSHVILTVAYSFADRVKEAYAQAEEIMRINPKYNVEQAAKTLRYKNKEDQERFINALRKAGLPE